MNISKIRTISGLVGFGVIFVTFGCGNQQANYAIDGTQIHSLGTDKNNCGGSANGRAFVGKSVHAATTQVHRYFQAVFASLHQKADASTVQKLVTEYDRGATLCQVTRSAIKSARGFTSNQIVGLYQQYLGRTPESQAVIDAWGQVVDSQGLTSAATGIQNSPEGQKYAQQVNGSFVTGLYGTLLGRAPDTGGYNGWLGALNSGTLTKDQVIGGFYDSVEYQQNTRRNEYLSIFNQPVSNAVDGYWNHYYSNSNSSSDSRSLGGVQYPGGYSSADSGWYESFLASLFTSQDYFRHRNWL